MQEKSKISDRKKKIEKVCVERKRESRAPVEGISFPIYPTVPNLPKPVEILTVTYLRFLDSSATHIIYIVDARRGIHR